MVNSQDVGKLVKSEKGIGRLSYVKYRKVDGKRMGFAVISLRKGGIASLDANKVEVV